MKRGIKLILFLTGVFLLWGCYPNGPDYVEEMDIVVTKHNPEYDFGAKATYAIPDKIVKVTGSLVEGDTPEFIPDVTAQKILERINKNMQDLGWRKVPFNGTGSDAPDLLLEPAAWETTTVYYWYDYWYWWYGGYYPYWGYPPVYYSSYTTGTLLMRLIDPDQTGADGNPIGQWSGAVNGILTYTYDATRMNTAIDKAFAASPYLNTK